MILPTGDLTAAMGLVGALVHNATEPHRNPPKLTPEDWSSLIGIVTAIVGNILISFALNTQRYAHIRLEKEANGELPLHKPSKPNGASNGTSQATTAEDREVPQQAVENGHALNDGDNEAGETDPLLPKPKNTGNAPSPPSTSSSTRSNEKFNGQRTRKNYLKSPYWWTGIILMVIGEAGNFLAYGFAPASIVSPLGVVALISNCIIAPIMLKEKFRKQDLLGVVIAVAGAVTVVLSAKGSNPKLGPDKIWDLIKRWEFLTYLGITVVLIVLLMFASSRYGHKTIMIDIGLVGLFGGYTALSTKGVASLFSYRLFDLFTFWISYLLVFVLITTAVMQIKYVNRALQRFDSTQVIPTQFVTFTIFVVVGSAILYRDFEKTTAAKVGQFVGGVALTFLGVWFITNGRTSSSTDEDYDEDEEHEINLVDEEEEEVSPPSTPKPSRPTVSAQGPSTPYVDSPASFATASSHLGPTPIKLKKPLIQASNSSPTVPSSRINSRSARSNSNLNTPATPTNLRRPYDPANPTPESSITPTSTSVPRHFLNRHSIAAGMTPGPYLSPLNAGLGMVLGDGGRRLTATSAQRAGLPIRRRSTRHRHSVPDAEAANLDISFASTAAGDDTPRRGSAVETAESSLDSHDESAVK